MSVRISGVGDRLVNSGIDVGENDFWIGGWFKCINLSAGESDVIALNGAETGASSYIVLGLLSDGSAWKYDSVVGDHDTGYNITENTWYYAVLQCSGTALSIRLFDDSTSTTPLGTASGTGAGDLSAFTYIILGRCFTGQDFDGEVEAWRAVTGEVLTDTQARAESQSYDYVLGGGTIYGNWRLKDVDADDDGINDSSANSNHLTNTGCEAGASTPTQLASTPAAALHHFAVEASGGGSIGTQTAGVAFNIAITAQDASNNTVDTFVSAVNVSGVGATLSAGGGTTTNFTSGALIHSVTVGVPVTGMKIRATYTPS